MRIDQLLVHRGLAATRSQAQRLIAHGVQWCPANAPGRAWRRVAKNGDDVPADANLQVLDSSETKYVSRAGLKLEAALQALGMSVQGAMCLDVGQSTGGFTDCLLQHGAACVVGVDVGSAQLHPRLRQDARVVCLENTNARYLSASALIAACEQSARRQGAANLHTPALDLAVPTWAGACAPVFDVVVMDVSFISQTLVLPAVLPFLKQGGTLLTLVKPQFELQAQQIGKGGIVKNAALYGLVEERLQQACSALGLKMQHWQASPIAGGDGNREFLMCAQRVAVPALAAHRVLPRQGLRACRA